MLDPKAAGVPESEWEAATAACFPLRVARVIDETPDTRSFVLEVPPELATRFRYRAGHFLSFKIPLGGKILALVDIYEALTAKDRPYKHGKTLSESLKILGQFKQNGHIDPDLFDIFVRRKVYLRYAKEFLDPKQIDTVDEAAIPGFAP